MTGGPKHGTGATRGGIGCIKRQQKKTCMRLNGGEEDSRGWELEKKQKKKQEEQQSPGSRLVLFTNDPGAYATTQ